MKLLLLAFDLLGHSGPVDIEVVVVVSSKVRVWDCVVADKLF